jgi:hypothetical protein
MSPKWTTSEQEDFLETWYKEYCQLRFKKKRSIFKDFWVNLKADWTERFGWSTADDVDNSKVPCLDKVSI